MNKVLGSGRGRRRAWIVAAGLALVVASPAVFEGAPRAGVRRATAALERVMLLGIGDSLMHGTMDATNNYVSSENGFLQKVADKLGEATRLRFKRPIWDFGEIRLQPFSIPTNLGVDGADSFSIEGLSYHKRAGTTENVLSNALLSEKNLPFQLSDDYDKVIFPINLLGGKPMSAIDAAVWQLTKGVALNRAQKVYGVLWIGNNESSGAALGTGGTPDRQPIPFHQIKSELPLGLRLLIRFAEKTGEISFDPYTQASIEQNLTDVADFEAQYNHVLDRLLTEAASSPADVEWLAITLPYYSSVGYLMDSEDIEFYLRKYIPGYSVPLSFKRVAPDGQPITDYVQGDRVALLTFGMMLSLAATGHTAADINAVVESAPGVQRDGTVLAEAEQRFIMARIDAFNDVIRAAALAHGPKVHVVDAGGELNRVLTGQTPVVIDGQQINRKWTRGGSFSLDGVHPGYIGQAFIANLILEDLNARHGLALAMHDLAQVRAGDPYVDKDGDGWAPGPAVGSPGITELLFLLTDPDDTDPAVQAHIPADIWDRIAAILLSQFTLNANLAREAQRLGLR